MPELPEVEGMRRRLGPRILGRSILDVEDISGTATRSYATKPFRDGVVGARFTGVDRRAKNLVLDLSTGDTLVMHFMRNGILEWAPTERERRPHTQAVLRLEDGMDLRLRDTMRMARWSLCPGRDTSCVSSLQGLGPEFGDPEFSLEHVRSAIRARSPLKALLVDQKRFAGVGNAYAHEIAWEAGIRPDRPGMSLTEAEAERLHSAVVSVLQRAIAEREKSVLDEFGDEGWEIARIHRRKGQPCPRCEAPIEALKVGGGLVFFCGRCQH